MNEYIAGSTTVIDEIFLRDVTSPTGGGKTGLVYNSAGLSCYYVRSSDTGSHQVTLATMTLGTYATGGLKEVDSTNAPGIYQFCPPVAAFAAGATPVTFYFQGAGIVVQPIKYRIYAGFNPDVTLSSALVPSLVNAVAALPLDNTVISNNLGYANGTPGSGTWTCPAGWTLATVLCFGAGGGGAGVSSSPGTGGGGGACAVSVLPLVPATTYNFFVGLGGSGDTDGTETWFDTDTTLYADSGYSPSAHTGNGRGGQASNCIGQFAYSGGNGGDQGFTDGGGGGGAAGPLGPGNSGGSDRFPGSGGLGSPAGGSGGMGAVSATATAAQPGQFPGGGGGAQSVNATGAAASGANGLLVIIPVLPATTINQALGATVDGSLTLLQVLTSLASFMNGALSVVNNNDGTLTLTFKKRDNSTTAFTVTFNNTTFARANAGGNG